LRRRAGDGDCNPTPDGRRYTGQRSVTASGRQCQAWTLQMPHDHIFTDDSMFADGSVLAARNYCRNPTNDDGAVWCFTTDPQITLEFCEVPRCGRF